MHTATITTKDTQGTATRIEKTTYDYDATGIRTSALHEIDTDANGSYETRTLTEFLVDHQNHTGYQQVVRETHYDADSGLVTKTVDYSFGHDEITQTTREYDAQGNVTSEETLVFGHDGHGNVRVLTDLAAAVVQLFVFDAYGQMLAIMNGAGQLQSGGNGTFANASLAATNLLYSGEQFDTRIGQQYLRARYYNATTGTFNRLDPFFGNLRDPHGAHSRFQQELPILQIRESVSLQFLHEFRCDGCFELGTTTWTSAAQPLVLGKLMCRSHPGAETFRHFRPVWPSVCSVNLSSPVR